MCLFLFKDDAQMVEVKKAFWFVLMILRFPNEFHHISYIGWMDFKLLHFIDRTAHMMVKYGGNFNCIIDHAVKKK